MQVEEFEKIETDIRALVDKLNRLAPEDPPSLYHVDEADVEYLRLAQKLEKLEKQPHFQTIEFEGRLTSLKEDLEFCKNLLNKVKDRI